MISFILIFIAAFFNAVMDAVENENISESIFKKYKPAFWYKRTSWKTATRIFGYKFDAWHLAKSMMIICFCAAAVLYKPVTGYLDVLIMGAIWNFSFYLFYHKIFGIK